MSRLLKLKRQVILEANQRNLGIIMENDTGSTPTFPSIDVTDDEVRKEKIELSDMLEILEYEVGLTKKKKDTRKKEIKTTLKNIRGNKKLKKAVEKKKKELDKLERQLDNLEDIETFKAKRKDILKNIFLTIYAAIGGVLVATDPIIKDNINNGVKKMKKIVSSL